MRVWDILCTLRPAAIIERGWRRWRSANFSLWYAFGHWGGDAYENKTGTTGAGGLRV